MIVSKFMELKKTDYYELIKMNKSNILRKLLYCTIKSIEIIIKINVDTKNNSAII